EDLREALKGVFDIERIVSKIALKSVNPKEMITLKKSLGNLPAIKELIGLIDYGELSRLAGKFDPLTDIFDLLDRSIEEDAPMSLKDGGIILSSFNEEIAELRDIKINGKKWIAEMEQKEREFTGIKSLKVGYNRVFGYYIEITKSNYNNIPEGRYIRKQTLANAERFITEDLKIIEDKILGAEEKLSTLEYKVFSEIRTSVELEIERLKQTARIIADIDCYQCLAKVARDNNYVKPQLNEDGKITISEGRHPVVEKMMQKGEFVSNDLGMNQKDQRFLIITGPNMAGKSTYMRQAALISLMAQIGSFIPAKSASLPISDRIFTRIGASDDLAGGKSTFMVEMSEVSDILLNATSSSLIILDEVGRGTSTYDGLSIAWAVIEHILKSIPGAKTLFATHYHELTALEGELDGVKNYSVLVKEVGKTIAFLRKIVPGGADESYGIEVARLAGLPKNLLGRAKEILSKLEKKDAKVIKGISSIKEEKEVLQIGLFDYEKDLMLEKLQALDVMNITPMEALKILYELNTEAKELN
ncbi:MAG TPA: DNA mismatch repair protein MutS, partial [Proteiniclasticum sp.]|nr:DNA mismatch repair protein MutS [Proteiniclasticum sp.]